MAAAITCVCASWTAVAGAESNGSFPEPSAPPAAAPSPPSPAHTAPQPALTAPTPAFAPPAASTPYAPPQNPPLPPYQPAVPSGLESLPPLLPYKKGLPVPPGYRVVDRAASGLIIGGGVTFLASYIAGLGLAATQSFGDGTAYTTIPVVGPWAAIGGRRFNCNAAIPPTPTAKQVQGTINKCVGTAFNEVTTVVFLTADGLVQAAGAVIFFVGLGSSYQELVRKDLEQETPKVSVYVVPGGGAVFGLSGQF